jgi:cation diffusion facilitator CzcD-associated flavoprotein CzcO
MNDQPPTPHARVAIVGSGFAGLGAAIRLRQAGVEDVLVFERADDVGGTWRDNAYPGCACDVPSHLYSFSFAPNPGWSRAFSRQPEIWAYLRACAERFGVRDRVRTGHELERADWEEAARRWRLQTTGGTYTADVLVSAVGAFSEPAVPRLAGLETFAGAAFHSARWKHGHDLRGRRVAVVGTGASAVQLVPEIQPLVARLHVFQRTAPWIVPRRDRALTPLEHRLYRRVPRAQRLARAGIYWGREMLVPAFRHPRLMAVNARIARHHLEASVPDPALRARLTPDYTIGCKRILLSNDYLPALTRPNVELVTDPIAEVRPHAIVTRDGVEREVDTIVFGTGFRVADMPIAERLHGRGGVRLADVWAGSPRAHLGTTVAGFPNLFLLLGPNTGLGHTSVVVMIESQIAHLLAALRHLEASGAAALEPRPEAQARSVAHVQQRMRGTVWTAGGCASWYLDRTGRNSTLWPDFTWRFRRRLERLDPREYAVLAGPRAAGA